MTFDVHQEPIRAASATLENPAGSRPFPGALRIYCKAISREQDSVIHNSAGQGVLYFVEDGLAVATKQLVNGKRQVVALYAPGDIINHEEITVGRSFTEVVAITHMQLSSMKTSEFLNILDIDRSLERAFYRFVAHQSVLAQEWLGNVGRRNGVERTAHLLCELYCRLQNSSIAGDDTCFLPLTQNIMADMTGLSLVHQNRSLKQIKDAGLISFAQRWLRIIDWNGLTMLADFDRAYLDVA